MSLARLITRSTYKKKKKIKFLHNSNEQQETEFLKTIISHTINDMKCLAVNWTKYVQDLCAKTTKHLKKKDMNKWSDILCSHILMLNTMKISILPNYRFKTIPLQISGGIFIEIDKLILKFTWKTQSLANNQNDF